METLTCGHSHLERRAAFDMVRDLLAGQDKPDVHTVLKNCFLLGSSAAADSAAVALRSCEIGWIDTLAMGIRPLVSAVPADNIQALASVAVYYAGEYGKHDCLMAFLDANRMSVNAASAAVIEQLTAASSSTALNVLVRRLYPFAEKLLADAWTNAATQTSSPMAKDFVDALVRRSPSTATEIVLPLLSKLDLHVCGHLPDLVRFLAQSSPHKRIQEVFVFAIDLGVTGNDSSACLALFQELSSDNVGFPGVGNALFCASLTLLRCCFSGDLTVGFDFVGLCCNWYRRQGGEVHPSTSAFVHVVALVYTVYCSSMGFGDHRKRGSELVKLSCEVLNSDGRGKEKELLMASEDESLEALVSEVKHRCKDGRSLSVAMLLLKTSRSLWSTESQGLATWIRHVSERIPLIAGQPGLQDVAASFAASLFFHPSSVVRFEAATCIPRYPSRATSSLLPVILMALGQEDSGPVALQILRCIGSMVRDKFSASSAVAALLALCNRQKPLQPEAPTPPDALRDASIVVLGQLAGREPALGLKTFTDVAQKVLEQWDRTGPAQKAAAAGGCLYIIRERPARGVSLVPILQKCIQTAGKAELAAGTALRGLRCLCDEGILDSSKTIRVVFKIHEPSLSSVRSQVPVLRGAFVYFLGAAAGAMHSKKGATSAEAALHTLREILVHGDEEELVVDAAAQALLNFTEVNVLTFVRGKLSEADEDKSTNENDELLYNWTAEVVRTAGKVRRKTSVIALLAQLLRYEWRERSRGKWSEVRILKLASDALRRTRQDARRSDPAEVFRSSAATLPNSVVKALTESASHVVAGDQGAICALELLASADILVTGLPWGELLNCAVQSDNEAVAAPATRAAFHLPPELRKPILARVFSVLSRVPDAVLVSTTEGILRQASSPFVGQVLHEFEKRGQLEVLFSLAAKKDDTDQANMDRLLEMALSRPRKLRVAEAKALSEVAVKLPGDVMAARVDDTGNHFVLLCFILAKATCPVPVASLVLPLARTVLAAGDTSSSRERLHGLADAMDQVFESRRQQTGAVLRELEDESRGFGRWGSTVLQTVRVACAGLWVCCSSISDTAAIVV